MPTAISPAWTTASHVLSGELGSKSNINKSVNNKIIRNSPLLFDMLKCLSSTERCSILDMGPASATTIDYFSDYRCKLFVTNSIDELTKDDSASSDKFAEFLTRQSKIYNTELKGLDLVLLWGLPNYMTQESIKVLISHLMPYFSNKLLLHTYIYNTEKMPELPEHYHIKNDNKVDVTINSTAQKQGPMYHLADLKTCFQPLKVEHSVMLSSGIQEYLFSV